MLASVQREQDDLEAARRGEQGQQRQQQRQQIQQQLLLPSPPQPPPALLQQQQQQQQLAVRLNLDPAFLAKCRNSRGPLLRAMIQEHTRRGLT